MAAVAAQEEPAATSTTRTLRPKTAAVIRPNPLPQTHTPILRLRKTAAAIRPNPPPQKRTPILHLRTIATEARPTVRAVRARMMESIAVVRQVAAVEAVVRRTISSRVRRVRRAASRATVRWLDIHAPNHTNVVPKHPSSLWVCWRFLLPYAVWVGREGRPVTRKKNSFSSPRAE